MTANDLKKELKENKPILGLDRTLKELRKETVKLIYISKNCRGAESVKTLAQNYGAKVVELKESNKELGVLVKKPFSVSVLCFVK
jgi:ribosomal protein L30E